MGPLFLTLACRYWSADWFSPESLSIWDTVLDFMAYIYISIPSIDNEGINRATYERRENFTSQQNKHEAMDAQKRLQLSTDIVLWYSNSCLPNDIPDKNKQPEIPTGIWNISIISDNHLIQKCKRSSNYKNEFGDGLATKNNCHWPKLPSEKTVVLTQSFTGRSFHMTKVVGLNSGRFRSTCKTLKYCDWSLA
jgi:hypothetical protein